MRKTALEVALREPMDFPWNPPIAAIKLERSVCKRASFIAPSTDSVPLLVKKQYCKSPGVIISTSLANMARSGSRSS